MNCKWVFIRWQWYLNKTQCTKNTHITPRSNKMHHKYNTHSYTDNKGQITHNEYNPPKSKTIPVTVETYRIARCPYIFFLSCFVSGFIALIVLSCFHIELETILQYFLDFLCSFMPCDNWNITWTLHSTAFPFNNVASLLSLCSQPLQ